MAAKEMCFNEICEQQRLKYLDQRTVVPAELSAVIAKIRLAFVDLQQDLKSREEVRKIE